jgi:hypothetical protein
MNATDVAKLFRMARAAFPAQKFDDYTPDLWVELFADVPYEDARAALVHCAKTKEWLNVKDLLGEVRRIRTKRINDHIDDLVPPAGLDPDDEPSYRRWLAGAIKALGDGEVPPVPEGLVKRDLRQLMAGVSEVLDAEVVDEGRESA